MYSTSKRRPKEHSNTPISFITGYHKLAPLPINNFMQNFIDIVNITIMKVWPLIEDQNALSATFASNHQTGGFHPSPGSFFLALKHHVLYIIYA